MVLFNCAEDLILLVGWRCRRIQKPVTEGQHGRPTGSGAAWQAESSVTERNRTGWSDHKVLAGRSRQAVMGSSGSAESPGHGSPPRGEHSFQLPQRVPFPDPQGTTTCPEHRPRGTGHWAQATGLRPRGTGHRAQTMKHRPRSTGHRA